MLSSESTTSQETMNQHFKKRKSRTSGATIRRPTALPMPSCDLAPSLAPASSSTEGANLSLALNALKVSLKLEMDSFAPPTPAVSPVHARSKRQRFDFVMDDDANTASENVSSLNNINPTPMKARVSSRVAVSNCLKLELEKKFRRDLGRVHQAKKRKPLNYFAIYGAFQRAARERNASLSVDRMDTECLATGL